MSACQSNGKFTPVAATTKCVQIPCTDDVITSITPLSGVFKTTNVGPIPVGELPMSAEAY